jgi:hypothetical protein
MKINFEVIPHSAQLYPTVGNYYLDENGIEQFRVSDMQNADYEFLVFIHECIEQHLTNKRGITEKAITDFDLEFEKNRAEGNLDEPGDAPNAPYRLEHRFAENIERQLAFELEVDWKVYNDKVESL